MVTAVLNIIPFLGPLFGFVIGIYELYLLTLALTVTHQYSTTKAVVTWLIPALVAFVLALCVGLIVGAAMFNAIMGGLGQ
jgi:hypothetical protein